MTTTKKSLYYISTDDSSFAEPQEFDSLADALGEFGAPKGVRDAASFERWLEKVGGYGFIEVDDVRIAEVRS